MIRIDNKRYSRPDKLNHSNPDESLRVIKTYFEWHSGIYVPMWIFGDPELLECDEDEYKYVIWMEGYSREHFVNFLNSRVEDSSLSRRIKNKFYGYSIGELLTMYIHLRLIDIKGIGAKSINEIYKYLIKNGIHLPFTSTGMDFDERQPKEYFTNDIEEYGWFLDHNQQLEEYRRSIY